MTNPGLWIVLWWSTLPVLMTNNQTSWLKILGLKKKSMVCQKYTWVTSYLNVPFKRNTSLMSISKGIYIYIYIFKNEDSGVLLSSIKSENQTRSQINISTVFEKTSSVRVPAALHKLQPERSRETQLCFWGEKLKSLTFITFKSQNKPRNINAY